MMIDGPEIEPCCLNMHIDIALVSIEYVIDVDLSTI